MSQSIACHTKTSRGRALPEVDVRTRNHSRPVSSRTPLHDAHGLAVGQWALRISVVWGDATRRRRARRAARIAAPGILSAINKPRGAFQCASPAEPNAIGTAGGCLAASQTPLCLHGENGCYHAWRAASCRTNEEHRVTILGS
jgi:hypothetical protein